jgi:selenocysteine-specific elongation factor
LHTVTLGTAGHVDHGKTALVRALTGVDTDRLPEERRRGVTIDLGFARLDLPGLRIGIVDVPGHERFVRNMLAGASGLDVAMLVVAADDGVMPQTLEHLAILELLDLRAGVIALTKTDLFGPDSGDWLELVEQEVRQRAAGTFLERAAIVRTSAHTGAGLEELKAAIAAACAQARQRDDRGPFRLAVDRAFVRDGSGTVITGAVWSGRLSVGDELEQQPAGRRVGVRGLQSHGAPAERVGPGQRAAVLLSGVHHTEIRRGDELASPGLLRPSSTLIVRLRALAASPLPIRHRMRVRLHLGTREVMARVRLLDSRELAPGGSGLAQLICAEPMAALGEQPLVVRAESPVVTIGGGRTLLPRRVALPRGGAREETLAWLRRLESTEGRERVVAATWLGGLAVAEASDLVRDTGLALREVEHAVGDLVAEGELVAGGGGYLHAARVGELQALVARVLAALHEDTPATESVPMARVAQRLGDIAPALVELAVQRLVADGRARAGGGDVALAGRGPKLSPRQRDASARLVAILYEAGFSPPAGAELATSLGLGAGELRTLLELHAARGDFAHLGGGLYLHAEFEAELRRRVAERLGAGPMLVADLRDLLGTSRKYAVPICEYLDRSGVTRRVGDARVAGPKAGVAGAPVAAEGSHE